MQEHEPSEHSLIKLNPTDGFELILLDVHFEYSEDYLHVR